MTLITELRALTADIYCGASCTFSGRRLSDNTPITVTGVIIRIQSSSWALVTIQSTDGSLVRIRMD